MRFYLSVSVTVVGVLLVGSTVTAGQQPPPIDGVTGTVALEGTVQETYKGVNVVVVKAVDGIEHLFHLTQRTVVHGGTALGDQALRGLDKGSSVVVHYSAEGDEKTTAEIDRLAGDGLKTIEGVVTKVDRRAKTISIRLADGSRQTLRLTERAAFNAGKDINAAADDTVKVVVYFNDEAGRRVAHYFRRIS